MSERPEEALEWLKIYCPAVKGAVALLAYITRLEAENAKLHRVIDDWKKEERLWKERESELLEDSKRLEELELALKEGDVCGVTATDGIAPGKYKYIEIDFVFDRNPVTRESLADAIDEAMEEPDFE